jgi:hypothetical protein
MLMRQDLVMPGEVVIVTSMEGPPIIELVVPQRVAVLETLPRIVGWPPPRSEALMVL